MCYRFAALLLFTVLPAINVLAAPVPAPSAILAIGPPPDPKQTEEDYRKNQREGQTGGIMLARVLSDPTVEKLPLIARMKDPCEWLAKNVRVREEKGGRRLRFTLRTGTRAEQVIILNAFLRANLSTHESSIKLSEQCLRRREEMIPDLEQRIKSASSFPEAANLRKDLHELRTKHIPELRAAIDRAKQIAVIRWAK